MIYNDPKIVRDKRNLSLLWASEPKYIYELLDFPTVALSSEAANSRRISSQLAWHEQRWSSVTEAICKTLGQLDYTLWPSAR